MPIYHIGRSVRRGVRHRTEIVEAFVQAPTPHKACSQFRRGQCHLLTEPDSAIVDFTVTTCDENENARSNRGPGIALKSRHKRRLPR